MALGYQARRERPPVELDGVLLRSNPQSYQVKFDSFITPVWLPRSQVEFHPDGVENDKPHGRWVIPGWLAKKERIAG